LRTREISWRQHRDARSIPGLDVSAVAKIILAAHGIFTYDRIPDFRKERYVAPDVDEFRSQMREASHPGREASIHPSLEGMEFNPEEVRKAISAVCEADESVFIRDHHGTPKAPVSKLVERLTGSDEFRSASRNKDRTRQMLLCLHESKIDRMIDQFMVAGDIDHDHAELLARTSMPNILDAIRAIGNGSLNLLASDILAEHERSPSIPLFDLAIRVLITMRHPHHKATTPTEHTVRDLDVSRLQSPDREEAPDEITIQQDVSSLQTEGAARDLAAAAEPDAPDIQTAVEAQTDSTVQLDVSDLHPFEAGEAVEGIAPEADVPEPAALEPAASDLQTEESREARTDSTVQLDITDLHEVVAVEAGAEIPQEPVDLLVEIPIESHVDEQARERLRKELRSNMNRIISFISLIREDKRPLLSAAPKSMERLLQSAWTEADEASGTKTPAPVLFENDAGGKTAGKFILDLSCALIAHENILKELAKLEPARPVGQIETEALRSECTVADSASARELVVADWLLQKYYGKDYVASKELAALSLMNALAAVFPDSRKDDLCMILVRRLSLQSPSVIPATLETAERVLMQDRAKELKARFTPNDQAAVSSDISEAREALRQYHDCLSSAEGTSIEKFAPDPAYLGHVECIRSSCGPGVGSSPGEAAIRSIENMRIAREKVESSAIPKCFRPAAALLLHSYSQRSVVALATALVDSGATLELSAVNDPFDKDLEQHLPEKTDRRTQLIRHTARTLNLFAFAIIPNDVRATIWDKACPEVSSWKAVMPAPDKKTDREIRVPTVSIKKALTQAHMDIIANAADAPEFNDKALFDFLNMDAGLRELRLRKAMAEAWTRGNWREDVPRCNAAQRDIYSICQLPAPTREQLRGAVCDPSNLSTEQREMISGFFAIAPEYLTPKEIEAFGVWLRGDTDALASHWEWTYLDPKLLEALRTRMQGAQRLGERDKAILAKILGKRIDSLSAQDMVGFKPVDKAIGELSAFRSRWFSQDKEVRQSHWRRGLADITTAASMAHKLRFLPHATYSREESEMLAALSGRECTPEEITLEELGQIKTALAKHIGMRKTYQPAVLALSAFEERFRISSLLAAVRRQEMFNIILDAFGAPRRDIGFRFDDDTFISRPKRLDPGAPSVNEDSCSSVHLISEDGAITMDAVFDGVGGNFIGEVEGTSNGERASTIAKSVFEISAAAGWISTPEDVRRTLVMADLMIVSEQLRSKEYDNAKVENDMGTTASVTFIKGDEFYGIHAGDSIWKVIREGKVVMESRPHDTMFELLHSSRPIVKEDWELAGRRTQGLSPEETQEFERAVESKARGIMKDIQGMLSAGSVMSTLGNPTYIHINNQEREATPFILQPGDVVLNESDGLPKRVCDHEMMKILQEAGGDVKDASQQLLALADGRMPRRCDCEVSGVEDDITFKLRRVEGQ